jgi:hypothetical protein
MAFVREADLQRLQRDSLLGAASLENPVAKKILEQFRTKPGAPWLALSWRQFLWWLADCEARIHAGVDTTDELLVRAEENWKVVLTEKKILFDEPANTGSWIRPWRAALAGFARSG